MHFVQGRKNKKGLVCACMHRIFMEFCEAVNYTGHSIINGHGPS